MTYKFELFLVTQKMAHKYKISQILSSSNFIFKIRYMIRFKIYIYIYIYFILDSSFSLYTELTYFVQILQKLKLDEIRGAKLNSN